MGITLLFIGMLPSFVFATYMFHNDSKVEPYCPPYEHIQHGSVSILSTVITDDNSIITLRVNCEIGFDLDGPHKITCTNRQWDNQRPRCIRQCKPPPNIINGYVEIADDAAYGGTYHKGALATYHCHKGFDLKPPESRYRVCEKSIWTGANATCIRSNEIGKCRPPNEILNGYYVNDQPPSYEDGSYSPQIRLYYSCKTGYTIVGNFVQQCLEDGTWSPKLPPVCLLEPLESTDDYPCSVAPTVPHASTIVVSGFQSSESAIPGTEVEIRCSPKYRNAHSPCQPSRLRCIAGKWEGTLPNCVPVRECLSPPIVAHGIPFDISAEYGRSRYLIGSKLSYQCQPGYELQGNYILTCSNSGCWTPLPPPVCKFNNHYYSSDANGGSQLLISIAIGAGVLSLLLVICIAIVCRRRKPLSRAILSPPVPRPHLVDHEALLHHPDRLALIAFADGMQVGQSVLPTYEEAIRERGPGLVSNRLQRPHWPSLAHSRRTRNSPDIVHVARQGSLVSTNRSAGDPMGSTDTVVVSEGSTAVTLDTASSYSGSQTASCRAHCGSLASFDTSSVHNTEGVPLLEENELEENFSDTRSLAMENQSMTDDGSYKLNRNSPDLA